jgi:hypothetical protein
MVATGTDGAATVGAFKHPLADMYLRRTLDAIVDVAQVVAHDFNDRPAHYGGIPVAVGDTLMQLRTASGSHPEWPTATQRASISDQIAGSQLCRSLAPLRRSAIAIAQQGGDRAAPPLRNDLLDSARAARSSCCAIDEELIIAASRRTGPIFEAATRVLCTPELAQALGQAPVPEGGWPDGGIYAQQMAHICEAISTRIERPHPPGTMTWTKFTILQRVGFWGGTTISALLDDSLTTDGSAAGDESGDRIIEAAYSWALGPVLPTEIGSRGTRHPSSSSGGRYRTDGYPLRPWAYGPPAPYRARSRSRRTGCRHQARYRNSSRRTLLRYCGCVY